jgi:cobalt-zinc-cadmium efflux system protein
LVAGIALVGIISNASVAYFASRSRKDLNARVVFLGNLVDIFSSFMALIAGILIIFTKQTWIDPAVSFVIATMLLIAAWQILREASVVLMEGVPKGINLDAVQQAIQALPKVEKVDDLHIWSIRSDYNALSCHIVIDETELKNSRKIVELVKDALRKDHDIQHATIEVELEDCTKHEEHESH